MFLLRNDSSLSTKYQFRGLVRRVKLGGTVTTVGFPDPGLQGFAPKVLAHGHHGGNRTLSTRGMRNIFPDQRAM